MNIISFKVISMRFMPYSGLTLPSKYDNIKMYICIWTAYLTVTGERRRNHEKMVWKIIDVIFYMCYMYSCDSDRNVLLQIYFRQNR